MFTIATVRRARVAYYLDALAAEEAPRGIEEPGVWLGGGARALGLAGAVDAAALTAVLAARDPRSRASLLAGADRRQIVAYDCTFSCPKSVSLLALIGPTELGTPVLAAHGAAVAATVAYLEREAGAVRRTHAGQRTSEAAHLIGASVVHRTSRAPDPHLHSHVLVANLAADSGGRYSALDARRLFAERTVARALYESELRRRLGRELGVCFARDERGVHDLVGLSPAVRRAFSQRSDAIAAALAASGHTSARAARVAAVTTRPAKDTSATLADVVPTWVRRSLDLGVPPARWRRLAPGRDVGAVPEVREALASFTAPFTRGELLAAIADATVNGAEIRALERAADAALADPAVALASGERVRLLGAGAARFPAARADRTYTTVAIEAAHDRVVAALGGAVPYVPGAEIAPDGAVFVAASSVAGDAPGLAAALSRLRASGRVVRFSGPDADGAARLAQECGSRQPVTADASFGRPGTVRVVVGVERLDARALAHVLASAGAGRGSLVLLGAAGVRVCERGRAPRALARVLAATADLTKREGASAGARPASERAPLTPPASRAAEQRLGRAHEAREVARDLGIGIGW